MTWHCVGGVAAEPLPQPRADVRVRLAGLRRRGVAPGADRPHRLVGDDQSRDLLGRSAVEPVLDLPIEHGERLVALALLERLADADDRRQPGADAPPSVLRLTIASVSPNSRRRSEWPMITYSAPASLIIAGADLAGERALALPVEVLRRDADVRVARRLGDRVQRGERRRDDDLDVGRRP